MERLWHNLFRTGSKYYPSKLKKMLVGVETVRISVGGSGDGDGIYNKSWNCFETPLVLPIREKVAFL